MEDLFGAVFDAIYNFFVPDCKLTMNSQSGLFSLYCKINFTKKLRIDRLQKASIFLYLKEIFYNVYRRRISNNNLERNFSVLTPNGI